MTDFDIEYRLEKIINHSLHLVILVILFMIGYWLGKKYEPNYSPYMFGYMLSSFVAGLVFCNWLSDEISDGKRVYYVYDKDLSCEILALMIKFIFYVFVGFIVIHIYSLWAIISIGWSTLTIFICRYFSI